MSAYLSTLYSFLFCTNIILSHIISELQIQKTDISNHIIERINWETDKPFAEALSIGGAPKILIHSVASTFPKWTIDNIGALSSKDIIQNVYKSDNSPYFGPYYDYNRPFDRISTVINYHNYETNFTIRSVDISALFRSVGPPYYSGPLTLSDFNPALEALLDIKELIVLHPKRSSVNLWLGMDGGVTPCHYDGYHNMYVMLSGKKKFLLYPPDYRKEIIMYPFLHPSYGQCQKIISLHHNYSDSPFEVVLEESELLYIPPYWIHEVYSLEPSLAVNAWTDILDSELLSELMSINIPGLALPFHDKSVDHTLPSFPITLNHLRNSRNSRLLLGASIVLHILYRSAHHCSQICNLFREIWGRYSPLVEKKILPSISTKQIHDIAQMLAYSLQNLNSTEDIAWWKTVIKDASLRRDILKYSKLVQQKITLFDKRWKDISITSYIEFFALETGGINYASGYVQLMFTLYSDHSTYNLCSSENLPNYMTTPVENFN